MKTKKHNHKTIHQRVEQAMSHRASVFFVLLMMFAGISFFDSRVRMLLQEAYAQGWGWIGQYMTHEHPTHNHLAFNTVRDHSISAGPGD